MIAAGAPISGPDVAGHYDELDRFYREVWGDHVHHGLWLRGDESPAQAVRQLVEVGARESGIAQGAAVADIGCGYGATARMLAEEWEAQVTAITISRAQYAVAVERNGGAENPRFLHGDWLANDFASDSFDAAIAIESSEHMVDQPAFFAEAHRVLRAGGRLVVCAWLSCEAPTARQTRWLLEPICREGRMPQLGSESDYRRMAEGAGFSVERMQEVTRQIVRTWPTVVRTFLRHLLHRPAYLRFVLDPRERNRVFALTIVRLWIAFRTGALRYGILTLRKPSP